MKKLLLIALTIFPAVILSNSSQEDKYREEMEKRFDPLIQKIRKIAATPGFEEKVIKRYRSKNYAMNDNNPADIIGFCACQQSLILEELQKSGVKIDFVDMFYLNNQDMMNLALVMMQTQNEQQLPNK